MDTDENQLFKVVINDEGHHSIWAAERVAPRGWNETGFVGEKKACLEHIRLIWTDMRPLSARQSSPRV